MGLLIRRGTVVNAGERFTADVKVEGRTIVAIGGDLMKGTNDTEIDAEGRYVLPGFIDPHVHMELPFMGTVSADDFETGTASGIAGGTTSIIDFCIPAPGTSLLDGLAEWKRRAAKATADYTFHMAITHWARTPPMRCAPSCAIMASRASRSSSPTRARSWSMITRSIRS
jgi:dihydropyrimidinase